MRFERINEGDYALYRDFLLEENTNGVALRETSLRFTFHRLTAGDLELFWGFGSFVLFVLLFWFCLCWFLTTSRSNFSTFTHSTTV